MLPGCQAAEDWAALFADAPDATAEAVPATSNPAVAGLTDAHAEGAGGADFVGAATASAARGAELLTRRAAAGVRPDAGTRAAAAGEGLTLSVAEAARGRVAARAERESRAGDDETDDDRDVGAADSSPLSASAVATPGPANDNPSSTNAAAPHREIDVSNPRPAVIIC